MEELRKLPQVVGGLTRADREMAANLFSELTPNIVLVDNLEEAEMVKIVNNTFRDVSFAYANELSLICDKFNLDTVRIINAANEGYPRNRVSLPSPGVGGACLKKDPHLLKYSCEQVGYEPKMITKSKEVNDSMPLYVFNKLSTYCTNQGLDLVTAKIFIMGLAFKGTPETSDVRHSSTLDFINLIDFDKKNLFGYDAVVDADTILSCGVTPASIEDGFKDANAVLIMNNHHSFRNINIYQLLETMKKPAIFFDTWHIFEPEEITKFEGISYASMGFITS
jgi:UDP-N-acetyl-D-mannosaminuronic acid dehydrogenase